ncbi:transposase family protein [Nonomuraea sp. NPDC050404]|uniref:transposase family protein n=1 Tax=Nonomuraea sp. NPDC050404 TaxID=3155783 RepID=UPI0033D4E354
MRRFDASPRRATPKGQPSSSAQHHIERSAYRSTPLRARGTLNVQVIATPDGTILWTSGALPGKTHDLSAARIWGILRALQQAGIITLADKAYQGAEGPVRTPYKGKNKPASQKQANRSHARLRGPGERANAQLKSWKILRKLRCSPSKAGHLCKAIAVLQNHRVAQAA